MYHAGRTQEQREKAHRAFESGRTRVLVATNAFGMGVDYPDVRLVAHLQAPGSLEAYYQEAGRASRDGEHGRCLLFFGAADMVLQRRLARSQSSIARVNESLRLLEQYAAAQDCRQALLCAHLTGMEDPRRCGHCDVCSDGEGVAQMLAGAASRSQEDIERLVSSELETIRAAVGNLRRPVGKRLLARALRGSRAKELRRHGLSVLPEHGDLSSHSEASIAAAIDQLLAGGQLEAKGRKYPTVWLPGKRVRQPRAEGTTPPSGKRRGSRRSVSHLRRALDLYRKRMARKLGWKPYMVVHNKVLLALDRDRPRTLKELEAIVGLGPAKIDRFGLELLDIVRRYDQPNRN